MDPARLAYMANQIARNFAARGEETAIDETVEHIRLFWDPRMKAQIVASGGADLSPIAAAAVQRLVERG